MDGGASLLEGTYDPIANQRQFEEALLEWRQGGKARENGDNKPAQAKTPRGKGPTGRHVSICIYVYVHMRICIYEFMYVCKYMYV